MFGESGNSKSKCRTCLLPDAPATEDEFGSHQRVAQAIADIINSKESTSVTRTACPCKTQAGVVCIGLEGGWGSGKSSVIRLLSDILEPEDDRENPNSDCAVFIFDAWAHQGDPLRRTFLEKLIIRLQNKWLKGSELGEAWKKRREGLAKRIKETDTKHLPVVDFWGKTLICSLYLVPMGLVFLTNGLRDKLVFWRQPDGEWAYIFNWGLVVVALPLFVLLFRSIFGTKKVKERLTGTKLDFLIPAEKNIECWPLFAQKVFTEEHNLTIETPDPTSIEFEQTFNDLMDALLQGYDRKIVLVIDNLDRIDPDNARSIWSTLQTFLQTSEHQPPLWFQKVWVMIPYDNDGLKRLWNGHEKENSGNTDNAICEIATSFMEKSFQIRFEVPPPILSDWRKYLAVQLKRALPNHDEADFYSVVKLFDVFNEQAPTPREIKVFVNQIGAFHRQWEDEIFLVHIALYVLFRRRLSSEQIIKKILENSLLRDRETEILIRAEDLNDDLAVLVFNVEKQRARQLLLGDPIKKALEERNSEELLRLESVTDGFWDALDRLDYADWINGNGQRLANIAYCLDDSHLLISNPDRPQSITIVQTLRTVAEDVNAWLKLDEQTADGVCSLLNLCKDELLAKKIVSTLTRTPMPISERGVPDTDSAKYWARGLYILLQRIDLLGFESAYSGGVEVPNDVEGFMQVCETFDSFDHSEYRHILHPSCDVTKIEDKIKQNLAIVTECELATIRTLRFAEPDVDWDSLITAIDSCLRANNQLDVNALPILFSIIWELKSETDAVEAEINELASQGVMLHYLYWGHTLNNVGIIAWCVFLYLYSKPDATASSKTYLNSPNGYTYLTNMMSNPTRNLVESLSTLIIDLYQHMLLITVLSKVNGATRNLGIQCLKELAKTPDGRVLFNPDLFMRNWRFLRSVFHDEESVALIKALLEETALFETIMAASFQEDKTSLYLKILEANPNTSTAYVNWYIVGLQSLGQDKWKDALDLQEDSDILDLVLKIQDLGIELQLSRNYKSALLNNAKEIVNENHKPYYRNYWSELLNALSVDERDVLKAELYGVAMAADGIIPALFFNLYGEELKDQSIALGIKHIVSELFTPIIRKSRNATCLQWVYEFLTKFPDFLTVYRPQNEVNVFRRTVANRVAGNNRFQSQIKSIAELVNVSRK